ncbi:hypothetical protein FRB97_004835 [Tulasnella sp. 331]|nr:hypothetical protein FRB97_004835 [Tulasnella sp. 331]
MSYSYLRDADDDEETKSNSLPYYPRTGSSISLVTTSKRSWLLKPDGTLDVVPVTRAKQLALSGLIFTLLAGIAFVTISISVYVISPGRVEKQKASNTNDSSLLEWLHQFQADPAKERTIFVPISYTANIALSLLFTILVTVCTEATGYVHGMTLKWGLADECRLTFNANLRLFSPSGSAFSMNGPVVNALYGITMVFAYAASSSLLLRATKLNTDLGLSIISFIPLLVLGLTLVIQATLGLVAFYHTPVLTWSSSPLDVTSALVSHGRIRRRPKRCMRSILGIYDPTDDPIRPSPRQPSPWASHKLVARVVYLVWSIALLWLVIGGSIVWERGVSFVSGEWIYWDGGVPPGPLLLQSLLIGVLQSVVTIGVHCCELVTTLARDEGIWRKASSGKGAEPGGNPLKVLFGGWQSMGLLVAKPLVHWIFGLAVSLEAGEGFKIAAQYMLVLGCCMIIVAIFITVIAIRRPSGPQPAAYGHIQTLADLVDEWSTKTMYWGHKGDLGEGPWPVCHAGTTGEGVLPPVKMEEVYA